MIAIHSLGRQSAIDAGAAATLSNAMVSAAVTGDRQFAGSRYAAQYARNRARPGTHRRQCRAQYAMPEFCASCSFCEQTGSE